MSEKTIESAILTATIQNTEIMKQLLTSQQKFVQDLDIVRAEQKEQKQLLQSINDNNSSTVIDEIHQQTQTVIEFIQSFDLSPLEQIVKQVRDNVTQNQQEMNTKFDTLTTHTEKHTDVLVEHLDGVTQTMQTNTTQLSDQLGALMQDTKTNNEALTETVNTNVHDIINEIQMSNKADNVETLLQLIEGLKKMHDSMFDLAQRMDILSTNTKLNHDDTQKMVNTIEDSNARILSMDLRMASLANTDGKTNTVESIDDTLALLERVGGMGE